MVPLSLLGRFSTNRSTLPKQLTHSLTPQNVGRKAKLAFLGGPGGRGEKECWWDQNSLVLTCIIPRGAAMGVGPGSLSSGDVIRSGHLNLR